MRKKAYVTNAQLLEQFKLSKSQSRPTDELVRLYMLMVEKISSKPNFANYSMLEDMKSEAYISFLRFWHKFNPKKSKNPFAYYTQVIMNAFIGEINKEVKHAKIRAHVTIMEGLSPSHHFEEDEQ